MKTFLEKKIEIAKKLNDLLKEYNDFTKEVAPSHWRVTGEHYQSILTIMQDISEFTEIDYHDKQIPWVKDEIKNERTNIQRARGARTMFNGDVVNVGDLVYHRDNPNSIHKVVLDGLDRFCIQETGKDYTPSKFLLDLCNGYYIKCNK